MRDQYDVIVIGAGPAGLMAAGAAAARGARVLLMDKLADLRDEGMSFDELGDWAEQNRLRLHHWFFS